MTGTTQEIAVVLGVDYIVATGLIRYLRQKGIAKEVGTRPTKGKGKPSTIFSVPATVTLEFKENDRKNNNTDTNQ